MDFTTKNDDKYSAKNNQNKTNINNNKIDINEIINTNMKISYENNN